MKKNKSNNKLAITIFLAPAFLIFTFVMLIPIIQTFYNSFFDWDIISQRTYVGFENYKELFTNESFTKAIKNMVFIALTSIVFQIIIALILAYLIVNLKRFKGFFQNAFFVPNVLSTATVGVLFAFIYNYNSGLLNSLLKIVGLGQFQKAWLSDTSLALPLIMVAVCWQYIGYYMMLFIAAIANIPEEIIESAKLDGVSTIGLLYKIIIPMIFPIIQVTIILMITGSVKFFDLIWVMTQGGPNHATETISTIMVRDVFTKFRYGYGSAVSTVLFLICVFLAFGLNKFFEKYNFEG